MIWCAWLVCRRTDFVSGQDSAAQFMPIGGGIAIAGERAAAFLDFARVSYLFHFSTSACSRMRDGIQTHAADKSCVPQFNERDADSSAVLFCSENSGSELV